MNGGTSSRSRDLALSVDQNRATKRLSMVLVDSGGHAISCRLLMKGMATLSPREVCLLCSASRLKFGDLVYALRQMGFHNSQEWTKQYDWRWESGIQVRSILSADTCESCYSLLSASLFRHVSNPAWRVRSMLDT